MLVRIGLSPREALAAATNNYSIQFGWNELGQIAPGRRADILVLDADPTTSVWNVRRISTLILDGNVVDREVCCSLRNDALQSAVKTWFIALSNASSAGSCFCRSSNDRVSIFCTNPSPSWQHSVRHHILNVVTDECSYATIPDLDGYAMAMPKLAERPAHLFIANIAVPLEVDNPRGPIHALLRPRERTETDLDLRVHSRRRTDSSLDVAK